MPCLQKTANYGYDYYLFKRNNAPLTNSVVGDELVGQIRIALQPFIAHSRRISLENEGSSIWGIGISANHEHRSLRMKLLSKVQMSSAERGSLLKNTLDIIVQASDSIWIAYTSECSTSGSWQPERSCGSWQERRMRHERGSSLRNRFILMIMILPSTFVNAAKSPPKPLKPHIINSTYSIEQRKCLE